jgi:hypothetical protein
MRDVTKNLKWFGHGGIRAAGLVNFKEANKMICKYCGKESRQTVTPQFQVQKVVV